MKYHQALAVAHYLDKHHLPLSTSVFIRKEDLRPDTYSPLRDRYPEGNISLPISELLTYTLQLSDNNACDILFDYIGGTEETEKTTCTKIWLYVIITGAHHSLPPG